MYPPSSSTWKSPQEAYETMATDEGVTCGNTWLAQAAASSSQPRKSPVYRYILTAQPSNPMFTWVGDWYAYYSFHTLDLVTISGTEAIFLDPNDANLQSLRKLLRSTFAYFALHGKVIKAPKAFICSLIFVSN
jgi:carboxylesterase type B